MSISQCEHDFRTQPELTPFNTIEDNHANFSSCNRLLDFLIRDSVTDQRLPELKHNPISCNIKDKQLPKV